MNASSEMPPVVVAGVFQTGVNLMRDLVRKGVRVYGVDCTLGHEGFRSVYGKSVACPNPDSEPGNWVDFMKSFAAQIGAKPVLIASADQFVSAIGGHAEALAGHYIFSREGVAIQAALATKEEQYPLVQSRGFPCPRTRYIQSAAELQDFAGVAQFPCLLKPRHEREWEHLPTGNPMRGQKVVTADSSDVLLNYYAAVERFRSEAIVQEIVGGPDTAKYCYMAVYGRDQSRLGYCVIRQVRTDPIYFGSASVVKPVADAEIAELCDEFFRGIGYVGLCEIELKRDSRDGNIRLIEVNPRYSVTADSAPYAGVELGWLHYLDMTGKPTGAVQAASRFDFSHYVLRREARAIPQYMRAGLLSWSGLFRSYRGEKHFFDFDLRDWRVTASTLIYCARVVLSNVLRKLGLK